MNEELTREVLEAIKNCDDRKCTSCPAKGVCVSGVDIVHIALTSALLEERSKPKVWDGAPGNAEIADVVFRKDARNTATIWSKHYTRDIPKTRTREIAENIVHGINGESRHSTAVDIEYVEGVLKRYAEELKGEV